MRGSWRALLVWRRVLEAWHKLLRSLELVGRRCTRRCELMHSLALTPSHVSARRWVSSWWCSRITRSGDARMA